MSAPADSTLENLWIAVSYDRQGEVEAYIKQGGDLNILNKDGEPLFLVAINSGKTWLFDMLLLHGADVNVKDSLGDPLICDAARFGMPSFLNRLLASGVNLDVVDRHGHSPLELALDSRNPNAVRALVQCGLPIPDRFSDGQPAWKKIKTSSLMALLQSYDVNLTIEDGTGQNILHHLAKNDVGKQAWEMADDLGLDINGRDLHGSTPLILAAEHGNVDACEFLLARGADITLKNNDGRDAWGSLTLARLWPSPKTQQVQDLLAQERQRLLAELAAPRRGTPAKPKPL
jgi:ankyrin repeat protein